jgi:hypothetical protein
MKHLLTLCCLFILLTTTGYAQQQTDRFDTCNHNQYGGCPTLEDSCDFSGPCSFLFMDTASTNTWVIATPVKGLFDSAYSPMKAILTDSTQPYIINNNTYFDLRFDLNDPNNEYVWGNCILDFKHRFHTDTLRDGGFIQISYDQGITWYNIIADSGDILFPQQTMGSKSFYTQTDTLFNGQPGFSGNSNGWIRSYISWQRIFGMKMEPSAVWIRFHFISDSIDNPKEGWMIDDIRLWRIPIWGGTQELSGQEKLTVYPNPMQREAFISINDTHGATYTTILYDQLGKTIQQYTPQKSNLLKIDRNHLPSGLYYIQVKSATGQSYTTKLLLTDEE